MIRYTLNCKDGHSFESWFQSADGFDSLKKANLVTCPKCGGSDVEKALMAPRLGAATDTKLTPNLPAVAEPTETTPASPEDVALRALKEHVEKNSEYVGMSFASQARQMHDGDLPARAIYGEAKPEEARKLIEDGVPALPLPFIPKQKTN